VDQVIRDLRASERMPGVDRIRVPGERSHETAVRQRSEGIAIAPSLMQTLHGLAKELRIAPLRTH